MHTMKLHLIYFLINSHCLPGQPTTAQTEVHGTHPQPKLTNKYIKIKIQKLKENKLGFESGRLWESHRAPPRIIRVQ